MLAITPPTLFICHLFMMMMMMIMTLMIIMMMMMMMIMIMMLCDLYWFLDLLYCLVWISWVDFDCIDAAKANIAGALFCFWTSSFNPYQPVLARCKWQIWIWLSYVNCACWSETFLISGFLRVPHVETCMHANCKQVLGSFVFLLCSLCEFNTGWGRRLSSDS